MTFDELRDLGTRVDNALHARHELTPVARLNFKRLFPRLVDLAEAIQTASDDCRTMDEAWRATLNERQAIRVAMAPEPCPICGTESQGAEFSAYCGVALRAAVWACKRRPDHEGDHCSHDIDGVRIANWPQVEDE